MNGTVVQLYSDCAALDGPDRISVIDVIFIWMYEAYSESKYRFAVKKIE
jgi:hypothetical protein